MMRRRLVPLLAVLLSSFATAAFAAFESPGDPLAPFGWFKDIAGHCWSGTYPDGKTSDTQCYSVQFGRMLRGTIRLSGMHGNKQVDNFEGASVYAWNPKARRVDYTFWASDGTYGTGEMFLEGKRLIFPMSGGTASNAGALRSVWRRVDADSFIVTREKRQGDAWAKVFDVTYRRSEAQRTGARAVAHVADEYVRAYRGANWRQMATLLADDAEFEDPTFRLRQSGKEAIVKMMQQAEGGFQDVNLEVSRRIIEPPHAVLEVTFVGRPRSKEGQPPNEHIRVRGITVLGVENGLIRRWTDYFDFRTFAEKLHLPVCKSPQPTG